MKILLLALAAACALARPSGAQQIAPGRIQGVRGVVLSPDGMTLASIDKRTIRLWDASKLAMKAEIKTPESPVQSVVFSPNGKELVSISSRTVHVWDASSGQELGSPESGRKAAAAAFSPSGDRLAVVGRGTLRLVDLASGRVTLLRDPGAEATSIVFSVDGNYLFIGSADYTVRVWNTRTQQRFVLSR